MIMNKQEQVFGIVEKAPINRDYTGDTTDTAVVTVDNVNRVIKVDVDFQGMLGETSTTAYPGHLGAQTRKMVLKAQESLEAESDRATTAEAQLEKLINKTASDGAYRDTQLREDVTQIQSTYATRDYVSSEISKFSTLSKQVVDAVDVDNNKVIVDYVAKDPVEGIIYLVKTDTPQGDAVYRQYTLVDGSLTLIGDTTVDLTGYAKLEDLDAVEQRLGDRIQSVQASTQDVKDVVDALQISVNTITSDYASKSYVQEEISKYSKISKQIATSVDLERNLVFIDGVETTPQENVVYLVPDNTGEENTYLQYTLISGVLTLIGGTQVDLTDYATKTYVDNAVYSATHEINQLLTTLKFIDGGTADTIQY